MIPSNLFQNKQSAWIITVIAIIWFALLGYRDLIDPDEGRYAEIPREMVASGDWLTPRLDGYKYFEKPALQYWMTALSLKVFGINNFAARLPVALLSFLGGIWILYVGKRLFGGQAGLYAFLFLMSSVMYVVMGHINSLDMGVAVFLALGIGALLLAQNNRDNRPQVRNWMLVGWAALALATLIKGLIGLVLPAIAIVIYTLWQRDWILWKHLHIIKGLLVYLVITAPWFIAVSRTNPEFAHFFFIHEHFERYTTTQHDREEPIYFHLVMLLVGSIPWIWSGLRAIVMPGFVKRESNRGTFDPVRFLWVYIIGIMLFFTMGKSALPPYILPLFPALALLVGRQLAERPLLRGDLIGFALIFLVAIYIVYAVTNRAETNVLDESLIAYRNWIVAATVVLLLGLLLGVRFKNHSHKAITTLAFSGLLMIQLVGWGFQTQARHRSGHELAKAIQATVDKDVPIYNIGSFVHSLPFYLEKEVIIVQFKGELEMGIQQEPEKWIGSWGEFARRWQDAKQAVAVFGKGAYTGQYRINMEKLPMKIIYQDKLKTAMVRR
jgi:4-amino-4-deoxy-L-arabinose transferase-like glycosyltransferase